MSDSPGDEADSRTASIGSQRNRGPKSGPNPPIRKTRVAEKRRRRRLRARARGRGEEVNDTVPKGASFSANSLEIDPDETSSSGSSVEAGDDSSQSDAPADSATANPHAGSTAPAISWNQGTKNAVRTSLGKRKAEAEPEGNAAKQFKIVNGTYWRSRSASVSSGASDAQGRNEAEVEAEGSEREEGEVDSRSDTPVSANSAADNSILLNIGSKNAPAGDYDPESLTMNRTRTNEHTTGLANGITGESREGAQAHLTESKEQAFQRFHQRYPTAPVALVDLNQTDFETVARYLHWDQHISEIDLQLPVGCIECHGLGHLADVCPTKECIHCGQWNAHTSSLCPSWKRCPRCRERGHTGEQCTARLKSSPSEVPCDLCGSPYHVESECERLWKLPARGPIPERITVSISCAHCLSSSHLIGDCPSLPRHLSFSSFSLHGIDPATIVNTNTERSAGPPRPPGRSGPPNRPPQGRNRNVRSPSPASDGDDMLARGGRRPPPGPRGRGGGAGRGAIRFGNGVGPNRGHDPPRDRPPPRRSYSGNNANNRPRSRSPMRRGPPPPRGGGGRYRDREWDRNPRRAN